MRQTAKEVLFSAMEKDDRIILLVGDLGFGMMDKIRDKFSPKRFINCGSAEQLMLGMAVGLALSGKIPICYSITSFLIRRPYEIWKLYLNDEKIPVKCIGGGRSKDYLADKFTHWSEDAKYVLDGWENIEQFWPETKEDIPLLMDKFLYNNKPSFLSLKR